jgi:hypothetical protein
MELHDLEASGHLTCEAGAGVDEIHLVCVFEIWLLKFDLGFGNWEFRA